MTHKEKWWADMIRKFGSEEAVREFLSTKGAVGGKQQNPNKGFGSDRKRASEAGKKGKK